MDLLQRLIAGSGSASSKQERLPTSSERLNACKKLCNALHNIWRSSSSLSNDDTASSHVASIVRRLNTILEEESRKAAPHSCLLHTASNQIYIIVAKLASLTSSSEVVDHAVHFFHLLINGEVEGVLDSKIFARSVIDLIRRTTTQASKAVDEQGESALIELLFEICTKIRLDPAILPAWFYPERTPGKSISTIEARRIQFPLFHILIDYVHYDGPIGDFARTALLYLTETASKSQQLEKWMMESDLAHLMASGLSALYGRLSRQAPSINTKELPILSFSDTNDLKDNPDESYEIAGMEMRAFLSYLAFWQDTLAHCQSSEVRDTLLDSFQILFVEQLLYPSLLESSDVNGGSTSAVILHLCRLLDALDQQQLVSRMLEYLFATKSRPGVPRNQSARIRLSTSRRRSMEQLATLASLADNPSPDLFNLLDLIVFSLRSSNSQTVTSALKLITVLLRRHHPYVKQYLFVLEVSQPSSRQNLNGLNDTMMTFFDYAGAISQVNSMDQSYQAALRDAQAMMEHHSCLLDDSQTRTELGPVATSGNDKVLEQMAVLLESWFANDTLINLGLTGALSGLAACEHVLMRTWLVPEHAGHTSIIVIIGRLVQQIKRWRQQFVEWDAFYSIQKVELSSEDEMLSVDRSDSSTLNQRSASLKASDPKSPLLSAQVMAGKTSNVGMDSHDRVESRGSTAVEQVISRQTSGGSAAQRSMASSASTRSTSSGNLSATLLQTRIPVSLSPIHEAHADMQHGRRLVDETKEPDGEDEHDDGEGGAHATASLRHVLTQAIILQEFILELAAALQIRATLFDEVDLS